MFLCAKSASATTAALGFAGYLLYLLSIGQGWRVPTALVAVLALTIVGLAGMRRSNRTNIAIVAVTLVALMVFVLAGLPEIVETRGAKLWLLSLDRSIARRSIAPVCSTQRP